MAKIKQIYQFIQEDLWRRTHWEYDSRGVRIRDGILKTLILCVRGFIDKGLNKRANALTYSLMFAIVPLLAVILAIARGFGFADILEQQLNQSFLGETDVIPTIMEFVDRYLETAQGGAFIGIGLLILLWAVYSFFLDVETSFNDIWNVRKSRSKLRQLVTYLAILFLIPVLIIVSAGLTIFLQSAHALLPLHNELTWLHSWVTHFVPFFTAWVIFSWMYAAIPNTRVRPLAALLPGFLMGTLFQALQLLSIRIIVLLSRTSIVYGAFASFPILLMWLQWSCLLMLIGAELSFAIQNNEMFEYEQDIASISRRYHDFLGLYLLRSIIERFCEDASPLSAHQLAAQNNIPLCLTNDVLQRLVDTGILREVYLEGNEDKTYQPAMDIPLITIGKVLTRQDAFGQEDFLRNTPPQMQNFWTRYCRLRDQHNTLNAVRVDEI